MNAINVLEGRTGLALMAGTRGEGGHVRRMSFDKMAQGIDWGEVKLQGEVSEEILKQMNVELDRVTASAREMQGVRLSVDGTYELTADGFALDHLGRPPSGCTRHENGLLTWGEDCDDGAYISTDTTGHAVTTDPWDKAVSTDTTGHDVSTDTTGHLIHSGGSPPQAPRESSTPDRSSSRASHYRGLAPRAHDMVLEDMAGSAAASAASTWHGGGLNQ